MALSSFDRGARDASSTDASETSENSLRAAEERLTELLLQYASAEA